jgi:hypothetical protein
LNWVGWLLLFGTFGFVGAEIAALVRLLGPPGPGGWRHWQAKVAAPIMVFLAIGFFASIKWLLGRLGVSIYRRQGKHVEPSAAADPARDVGSPDS